MSSGKDTPRQKMIGMMYLVLTALLALNVSKDILDAFIVVNKGLENTNKNFVTRNENLYAEFDLAKSIDPARVTHNWKLAQAIKERSATLTEYINKLQKQIVAETDKITPSVADTLKMANISSKDNYDIPTNILIGDSEDGSKGVSRILKNKLIDYRGLLTECILPKDRKNIKLDIDTENPASSETNENWELYHFYHRPIVASITILSKIKNDIKNAESVVVDYLLKQNDSETIKFDTIAAKVVPQSNYVLLGEEYKADVFLAAFNKTKKSEMLVGKYDETKKAFQETPNEIAVDNGLGRYTVKTNREGIMSYSGIIKTKSAKGEDMVFPFQSEYIVAKPSLTVAADNMNVVYAGLDNPITVSVPGIPNDRLTVSASNATLLKTGNGKFMMNNVSGSKVDVKVVATMETGEKKDMGIVSFRVKQIPTPVAKVAGVTGDATVSKSELITQKGIFAFYDNFNFNVVCKVVSFEMSYNLNGISNSIVVNSNYITEEIQNIFKKLRKNEKIRFENIKAVGPNGKTVSLNPLCIKVN
jgi:gliding motility-associated protein GldM